MTFKAFHECIRADAYRYNGSNSSINRLLLYFRTIGYRYTYWMRLCALLHSCKILYPLFILCLFILRLISYRSGIQIPYSTCIGKGFYIGHFGTMVITPCAKIGKNVNISPGINIGKANRGKNKGFPTIGDNVYIGPGAKIIGAVHIGSNVAIGANAVVTKDVPNDACVAGVPARVLSMDGAEGYVNNRV